MAGRLIELPPPRGPLSEQLFEALEGPAGSGLAAPDSVDVADPLADDDLQLALYVAYELHYTAIRGVEESWERSPSLLAFRVALEEPFEAAVAELVPPAEAAELESVGAALQAIVAEDSGPPLSRYMETQGTREQMLEHVVHRSAYQLKEADPHSWAIPRLGPAPKAALLEVQFDEYGGGDASRMHSALFAETMAGLGLDPTYGRYIDRWPGITLATVNLITNFGLQRRRRGALVGHLAGFEMTSSIPNRRYGNALRRLGFGPEVTHFYDEHVAADAVHENIAAWDLAGGLAAEEPEVAADVLFGARALLQVEARWARHLMDSWERGEGRDLAALAPRPARRVSASLQLSYVVPVRWRDGEQRADLAAYLTEIAAHCAETIVVDGSPEEVFAANAAAWGDLVTQVAPLPDERWLMGKVSGVRSGIRLASHERVVIADDDVRYDPEALRRTARLLDEHDLVRPQNYFSSLPWHARWDTARTLLNRSLGRDYPGTLAVRRSRLLEAGLYDGDVLFENLELIRTVRAAGGSEAAPLDLYVARVPPSASHFWGQRTRQAYDDFALPPRMALWLAILPLLALTHADGTKTVLYGAKSSRRRRMALATGVAVALAERGRRRGGGAAYFPATSSLLAPLWVLERALCGWLAVLQRLRYGGVRYGDSVIPRAAHSERQLRAARRRE